MLSLLKIILLIIGIPTLPLGFFVGIPFMVISFTCLFGAVAIDRYQTKQRNNGVATSSSNSIWSLVVLMFGVGIYFAITSFASLGNLDTTGKADSSTKTGALIFCIVVIVAGLAFVNRKKA